MGVLTVYANFILFLAYFDIKILYLAFYLPVFVKNVSTRSVHTRRCHIHDGAVHTAGTRLLRTKNPIISFCVVGAGAAVRDVLICGKPASQRSVTSSITMLLEAEFQ